MHIGDLGEHPCRAGPDLLPNGAPFDDDRSALAYPVPLHPRTAQP